MEQVYNETDTTHSGLQEKNVSVGSILEMGVVRFEPLVPRTDPEKQT
jgi:hypothetical protein